MVAQELQCPDCGGVMELYLTDGYSHREDRKVEQYVYHCQDCGHDDVIEMVWERTMVTRRRYFHG